MSLLFSLNAQIVNKKYSSLKLLNMSNNSKLNCDFVLEMAEKDGLKLKF